MLGYKIAEHGNVRVLVTLEIPDDALTNMNRYDIFDAMKAKYRTNKAKVLDIEDEQGTKYTHANSCIHNTSP